MKPSPRSSFVRRAPNAHSAERDLVSTLRRGAGCSLAEAALTVGEARARLLGMEQGRGVLQVGALADLELLDEQGPVLSNRLRGECATDD